MKTENLVILFTDIAGYTESVAKLSRKENEELLAHHNDTLYPIIRSFSGRVVKTIGDALLIVFRSPTDAMLCAMAMQDSLYDRNRSLPPEKQIHIRVAASLGEVRLENNDIFGEPVNTTSRIENITPQDEIYLSDAVYMAMSKAEVPCVEVGLKTLKGISEPVKIWQIPRFSRNRLVSEDVMKSADQPELTFPYGGAHLIHRDARKDWSVNFKVPSFPHFHLKRKHVIIGVSAIALVLVIAFLMNPRKVIRHITKPANEANALDKITEDLVSKDNDRRKSAARVVCKSYQTDRELLDVINRELLRLYAQTNSDRDYIDTMGWFCNALGGSKNSAYRETLEKVYAGAPSEKLRGYAERNLKDLPKE